MRMRKDLAIRNEDTFLGNIKLLIFKSTREVEDCSSIPDETAKSDSENWATKPTSNSLFMERSNINNHLDININRISPRLHPDDELALASLSACSKPSNSKPDLTFGTSNLAWTSDEQTTSSYIMEG
jgi:hypothetical protein